MGRVGVIMEILFYIAVALMFPAVVALFVMFGNNDVTDWLERDEYYKNRWYK